MLTHRCDLCVEEGKSDYKRPPEGPVTWPLGIDRDHVLKSSSTFNQIFDVTFHITARPSNQVVGYPHDPEAHFCPRHLIKILEECIKDLKATQKDRYDE